MIKDIIEKWENNKDKLENFFKENNQEVYDDYTKIVKNIIHYIVNEGKNKSDDFGLYDIDKIHEINDGDYQGTLIFIIPMDTYQPSLHEYIYTSVYYGSCSGCDTLQSIQYGSDNYGDGKPTKEQVKDYMLLSLNIIQNMRYFKEVEY